MSIDVFKSEPESICYPQPWMMIRVFKDRVFGVVLGELWTDTSAGRPDTSMFRMACIDAMYSKVLEKFFSVEAGIAPNLGGELDIPIYDFMTNTRYGETMGKNSYSVGPANGFGVEVFLEDNEVHRRLYHIKATENINNREFATGCTNGYSLESVGVQIEDVATMPPWPLKEYRLGVLFTDVLKVIETIPEERRTDELRKAYATLLSLNDVKIK